MRDLIQKTSDTDKQITLTLLRSIRLNSLLSIGSISAGTLSIFSLAAILGMRPAQANFSEPSASLPEQTLEEAPAPQISSNTSELTEPVEAQQDLTDGEPSQIAEGDEKTAADITSRRQQLKMANLSVLDTAEFKFAPPIVAPAQPKTVAEGDAAVPTNALSSISVKTTLDQSNVTTQFPTADEPTNVHPALVPSPPTVEPTFISIEYKLPEQLASGDRPTTVLPASAFSPATVVPAPDSVGANFPEPLAIENEPTPLRQANVPSPTQEAPAAYSGPGGASLLEGNYQAQASGEDQQDSSLSSQNSSPENDPLSPTLDLQGVYIYQGDSSARARLRGIYPVSPNALFGAVVDLATGDDFVGSGGGGLDLNELYFTGNLPSYPNLRLTAGLMDLTSYFDRNSFAKDNTTHFFHPLFQTNPALAAAGIGSRPGALLNWNITDNVEARAAVFSSDRSLGDFNLDAFAGEIGFRAGNAIVRATYASDQDTGRDGVFGTRSGDREHAFGINGELFVPQIKLGLFARYGWLDNSDQDENTETYNLGFNFLDLFRKDDRLGLGYANGPDFSEDDDVWEVFYDTRIARNLRAGVTLQARDGFEDTVFGFRVKTDLQLYP